MSQWFENTPEAPIETSTVEIRNFFIGATLDDNEVLVEAIEYSVDLVYSRSETTPVFREVFAELMENAVTDITFMCNGTWYRQKY